MDPKRMIIAVLLITAIGLGWQYFIIYEYGRHPEWKRYLDQQKAAPVASTTGSAPAIMAASPAPDVPPATLPTPSPTGWQIVPDPGGSATSTIIGSNVHGDQRSHMELSLVAPGAAVESVVLNQFRREADSGELFTFQNPYDLDTPHNRSLATIAMTIDGTRLDLGNQDFSLLRRTNVTAQYAVDALQGGEPAVRLVKQYVLEPVSTDPATSQGYEVEVDYSFQNLSKQPHAVSIEFAGPTVPKAETARQETEIAAGYDNDGLVKIDHQPLSAFNKSHPDKIFSPNADNTALLWLGASSNYFNGIVRPDKPGLLAGASASALNPESELDGRLVAIRFTSAQFNLPAGGSADLPMHVFFGPKERALLNSKYYGSYPLSYDQTLVFVSNWICGLCTSLYLISLLVFLLNILHYAFFGDWGLAIIALVVLVRLLLHPVTKRSQVSMMKMQKLAPEIERLKKKFGDDKDGFTKAQMELYKSVGFTPIMGCLPMFFQMPIFIALWRALQTTFELRQAPFLYFFGHHLTWIHDLSQPDALVKFATPILLPFGWHMAGINVLPLAMAVVTFINTKYFTPRPAAMSPEQEQQQKMMTWMTLLFPIMFYTFPSGLNLYYFTTTSAGIVESKRIRDHIKQMEEAEAGKGPVIVDAGKPNRAARRRQEQSKPPEKKGWLARLQERAEEMAREAQKRKR